MKFEFLVAVRYLKAKRKQAAISLITLISIVGVAAGVAALIIALAITAGFREDLTRKLLGAQAHVSILPKGRNAGISDYMKITQEVSRVPGVVFAAPAIYQKVLLSSQSQSSGVILKGIIPGRRNGGWMSEPKPQISRGIPRKNLLIKRNNPPTGRRPGDLIGRITGSTTPGQQPLIAD